MSEGVVVRASNDDGDGGLGDVAVRTQERRAKFGLSNRILTKEDAVQDPKQYLRLDDPLLLQLDGADDTAEWLNGVLEEEKVRKQDVDGRSNAAIEVGALLSLEGRLAKLSTTLSIARQDTLAQMDNTMSNVTSVVPRLGLEMRLMREAALTLKTNITRLRNDADQAGVKSTAGLDNTQMTSSSDAVAVLERLAALHALHARMSAARDVLSLAESWSTLSTDVNAYLADAKFDAAAVRIAKAKTSLSVFERTPEYESRKRLLDGLASALETRLTPTLVDAVRDRDVGQTRRLFDVLVKVDRQVQMMNLWRKTRSEECLADWSRTAERVATIIASVNADSSSTTAGASMEPLRHFANTVVALLDEERKIVGQLLPVDPRTDVKDMTHFLLSALEPNLSSQLSKFLPQRDEYAILFAVEIHKALRYFAIGVATSIARADSSETSEQDFTPSSAQHAIASAGSVPSQSSAAVLSPESKLKSVALPVPATNHTRQLSVRRASAGAAGSGNRSGGHVEGTGDTSIASMSGPVDRVTQWDGLLSLIPPLENWETKLFEPLLDLQTEYETMERKHFASILASSMAPAADTIGSSDDDDDKNVPLIGSEISSRLKENITLATGAATQAAKRTRTLTYGLGCDGLVSCVDEALASILQRNKELFDRRASNALSIAQRIANGVSASRDAKLNDGALFDRGASGPASSQGAEWKAFEEGMGLFANLQSVTEDLQAAEQTMSEQVVELADLLFTPFGQTMTSTMRELLNRLCTDDAGTQTSSFRLLLEASQERLRNGSLTTTLKRMKASTTSGRARSVAFGSNNTQLILFQAARVALLDQMRSIQRHLINVILSPLMPHLQVYAGLPIWAANRLPGSVNEYDLTMPTFSLSPTEEMSGIGEALLELPRLLEVWSDLPQFRWSVQGLAYAGANEAQNEADYLSTLEQSFNTSVELFQPTLSPSPKREKRISLHVNAAGGAGASNPGLSPTMERRPTNSIHRQTPSVAAIATLPARGEHTRRQEEQNESGAGANGHGASPQSALQAYLTSISMSLISHLVSLVLPSISQLTGPGASQLAADLEYLLTILSALNVTQQDSEGETTVHSDGQQSTTSGNDEILALVRTLEAWKDVCTIKDQDGRRLRHLVRTGQAARGVSLGGNKVGGFQGDEDRLRSLLGTPAFDMVSRMRGW